MTFLRTCLREKPSALYMMDDTTPFQDHSSYNRVGVSVGTAPTTAPALVKGAAFSQVFKTGSTAKFESPLFRQGYEKQNFTLEAAVRTINVTGTNASQVYQENLALNPVGVNSGQANSTYEYLSRWSWIGSWITGASDSPIGRTTYIRQTSPASIQTASNSKGVDQYVNPDATPLTNAAALAQPVVAGDNITVSCWVRSSLATQFVITHRVHDGAANWLSAATANSAIAVPANTWTRVFKTFTVPNTGYLSLSVRSAQTQDWPASSTLDFTGLLVQKNAPNPGYFDGATPGFEWSGIAHASKSRSRVDVSRVNWNQNPGGEAGTVTPWGANAGATLSRDTTEKLFGAASIKVVATNATGVYYNGVNSPTVNAGQKVTLTTWLKGPVGQTGKIFDRRSNASTGAWVNENNFNTTFTFTGNWQRVVLSFTQPVDSRPSLMVNTNAAATYYIDGTTMELDAATPADYFDGDSVGATWFGAQHTTASMLYVSNSSQQVLSNLNQYDGLTINGTIVSFGTKYLTSGNAIASYDLQQPRAVVLHGVHTQDKNSLFVDGVLAAEVSISTAQQTDQFVATDAYLYSGTTTSSQAIALNGIGVYPFALPADAILRHAQAARAVPRGEEVVPGKGGDYIPLSLSNSDLFLDQWWSTALDWNTAQLQNVAVKQDQLVPQVDNLTGLSLPGAWYDTFGMDNSGATSLYGISLNWDGVGATVEVSLDGTTWETAQRGRKVALIPPGYNPTNKELQLRVSFPGGILNDTSYIDNLNVIGLKSGVPPQVAGRTITLTGAHQERDHFPLEMHDNWGVEVDSGGTVVISADTSGEASVIRTMELWIKATTTTNPTVSFTGTYYQNGAASTVTLPTGVWTLFHIVGSADEAGAVTITGPAQIGQVGIYSTALSASEVASIYATYVGTNIFTAPDSSTIVIAESTPAAKIYASDWAIQGAG